MKTTLLVLGFTLAVAYSSVVPTKGERKLADANFLKQQKQVLELYIGLADTEHFQHEYADFDFQTHSEWFTNPMAPEQFKKMYKQGYLPKDEVFTMSSHLTKKQTIYLFDLFYFAKDFEAFYKVACWAKKHINPVQFAYAYTLALIHREDCSGFRLPPMYEIFPSYYVPQETLHKIYMNKMNGIKEGKFKYNNTGYEYNYHSNVYGGPLGYDVYTPHTDYKISYIREDVGLNNFYTLWNFHYPSWMNPEKYKKTHWFKRGEGFYYTHQQLFARYSLERIANGLPYVEPLYWNQPIKTGYTPKISYHNGKSFQTRPDNWVLGFTNEYVQKAFTYGSRLWEAVDGGVFYYNDSSIYINDEDGVDQLGKIVYGAYEKPTKAYYGSYFHAAMDALGYSVNTKNEKSWIGGATTTPCTALRDPAYYGYLNQLIKLFQMHKKNLHYYTQKDLSFPGVAVKNFEVDKLVTYFERFFYEVSNGVPVKDYKELSAHKYVAGQYRLSHKPFTYKITVNSDNAYDGIVRVFIGPKYDAERHVLTLEQKRMMMFEIDRFPVKMTAGENVFERNSKESPIFTTEYDGLKQMYNKVINAMQTQETYYIKEKVTCGVPERMQLPHGGKNGELYTFYVVVSPFEKKYTGETKEFYTTCGSAKLYDYRPLGYPFDKPIIEEDQWNVANIYYKDVPIYHKGEFDVNTMEQQ